MDQPTHHETSPSNIDRRTLLRGAAVALPLAVAAQAGAALGAQPAAGEGGQAATPPFPGLISRLRNPDNLEFPFATLDRFLTPTDRFYVRSHFPTPSLEVKSWRLRVEGVVDKPLDLTFDQLRKFPERTVPALLECSGNSRIFLTPRPAGVLWELGAVGTAEWTGVPLAAVLERAGVRKGAVEVILEGADSGETQDFPNPFRTPGRIHFARSLPLAKARRDVLLAYRMNGEELTLAHGYPLRAIVPGWYGMASIKWLTRLVVTDLPFQGYFQTMEYAYYARRYGLPTLVPVTELQVKAQIARPALGEVVPAKRPFRVFGAAWAGEAEVARVEVSTDGGKSWALARLLDKPVAHAWRLWEHSWKVPGRGRYTLMARATDKRGRTQLLQHDPDRRNTMISHVLPVEVEAR
ncbi:MAG: sulfite oxidase [Gemmataceae bacterium]|nr:sulfite oxidase [Gemmataceae bacterium]